MQKILHLISMVYQKTPLKNKYKKIGYCDIIFIQGIKNPNYI